MPRTPNDFGKAFTALLDAAGLTVDQVLRKRPGVATRSTLYDWKKGDHLPADTAPLLAVVELCLGLADSSAALRSAPRDTDGWLALLAEAKQSRGSTAIPGPGAGRDPGRPGRLIGRWDPAELGVHKAIGGRSLTPYVHRPHDHMLYALLDSAPAANRLVVLRGGSSTGKSRAAYQAVTARLPHWPVLYPRTAKALARLLEGEQLPGRSVLWLNELRDYAEGSAGQETLFDLAELLTRRNHIVVLTSVWPEYWRAYTTDHRGGPGTVDPMRAIRQLLSTLPELTGADPRGVDPADGGVVDVPDHFSDQDLHDARCRDDPTLNEAIAAAEQAGAAGQLAQFLAGVPDLIDHYHGSGAHPYGHALINAAMDATLLDRTQLLSRQMLDHAAVGYLSTRHRALSSQRWSELQEHGWAYVTYALKGAIQALQPVPPEQGTGVAGYRLADYLDQHGRSYRTDLIPPPSFWAAVAAHAHPGDLERLGDAAWNRGLYRFATQLHKNATKDGNPWAARSLVEHLHQLHPSDHRPAAFAAAHAALDNPSAVAALLGSMREVGARKQVAALVARDPAAHANLRNLYGVADLLGQLREARADTQAAALLARAPFTHVSLSNPSHVADLLDRMRKAGAKPEAAALAERAMRTYMVPAHRMADMTDPHRRPRKPQAAALARRAAEVTLDDPGAVADLLEDMREVGTQEQVAALLARDPAAHANLENPGRVAHLLGSMRKVGAQEQVAALVARDPAAHVNLGNSYGVAALLDQLWATGARNQATALAVRAAERLFDDEPSAVAALLESMREVGAEEQVAALVARDPAAHVNLGNSYGIAALLDQLWATGVRDQATALAARLPAAGMFSLFLKADDHSVQYRFGREPDGRPANRWSWDDLD
ncbi:hypothetical protein [Streptomyces nigra]|uniref:hypothetical protein n=1 Tax=Streptomyces nigra TaxID=1827580 RepID=UPI0035E011EC